MSGNSTTMPMKAVAKPTATHRTIRPIQIAITRLFLRVAFTLVTPIQGQELQRIEKKINDQLSHDPLQDEIDEMRGKESRKPGSPKPVKSRYRRAL